MKAESGTNQGWVRALALMSCLVLFGGCGGYRESTIDMGGADGRWRPLLADIRNFERRIGFVGTGNFTALSSTQRAYPFCGHVSRLVLPYSYEDPAITWLEQVSEAECHARGRDADVYSGESEALGEIGSPVTNSMINGKLDRFIYLVIHEDCHDQFEFPHGIEEALCNLIAYKAMIAFAAEKYGAGSIEYQEVRRYADTQTKVSYATVVNYERLATLYSRYDRKEIAPDLLLRERAEIFSNAKTALRRAEDQLNNVSIANQMTYSRHYPLMESAYNALGRDVGRTVAFFKQVDTVKPSGSDIMARLGANTEASLEFIRGYEVAVVEAIRRELVASGAVRRSASSSF